MTPNGCLICASLLASSVPDMLNQIIVAGSSGADLVELRVDKIIDFKPQTDLPTLLRGRTLPVIVTYRPKWGGGEYEGDDHQRLDALELAVDLGADFVDVELQVAADFFARFKRPKSKECQIIISSHNYQKPLSAEDLGNLVAEVQCTGADVVRIVTNANRITDVAPVFQILSHTQVPTFVTVTGSRGLICQLLCPKFGGYLTVGSLESDYESTSGLPTLLDLTNVYRLQRVSSETKVFGVVSNPVGHSKGPILHNAAFMEIGFDAIYVPFLVDDLADFFRVYSSLDFAGFSIGLPHKEAALKCCDEVDPVAKAIGAVNTIIRRKSDGKLIGYNTDCWAAISAIEEKLAGEKIKGSRKSPLTGRLFVVVGAGGAGKALAFGAKERGARVIVVNRNHERAKILADFVGGEALSFEALNDFCPESGMLLANASSVGMHPNVKETPIAKKALKAYSLVFDAVYTPGSTRLLREAEEAGAVVVSGLDMFVRQAVAQFELFTGHLAPKKLATEIKSLLQAAT